MAAIVDTEDIRRRYDRQGYVKVQGAFSLEEVAHLRESCALYRNGDILSYPAFGFLPFDDRILNVARALLGSEIIYFGESAVLYNATASTPGHRHYHNDSRADDFDFDNPYPVIRLGLYLQDHVLHSGGLKLRPGSHKRLCLEKYGLRGAVRYLIRRHKPWNLLPQPSFNIDSTAGDLLAWNMRIHHTGYALRLRAAPGLALHPHVENLLPARFFLPEERSRCVVFMSYAAPGEYFERYIRDRVTRTDMKAYWQSTRICQDAKKLAREKGVQLRTDGIQEA